MEQAYKEMRFITSMVLAILKPVDPKRETRRPCKPQPDYFTDCVFGNPSLDPAGFYRAVLGGQDIQVRPKYKPGDIAYVRETWADLRGMGFGDDPSGRPWEYAYRADCLPGTESDRARKDYGVVWRPSIHMPREAARLFLKITGVNLERLDCITEAGALAEGFYSDAVLTPDGCDYYGLYAYDRFFGTWRKLYNNGPYAAELNPWVFRYTFEQIARPEDWPEICKALREREA